MTNSNIIFMLYQEKKVNQKKERPIPFLFIFQKERGSGDEQEKLNLKIKFCGFSDIGFCSENSIMLFNYFFADIKAES